MGFRSYLGNEISEDGWRICDRDECVWSTIPGTNPPVTIQLRKGVPTTILVAFAARFNKIVEPLRDPDTAGWTETNSVPTSNHLAGTAMDLNWNSHPFHARGTFGDKLPALRQLLDDFDGCVWWGGDWNSPIDEMHFQLNYPEGDQRLVNLARKLGALNTPTTDDPREPYIREIIAEGRRRNITPKGIQIALATAIVESNLKMYANSSVPASLAMPHDAVGSDYDSVGLFQQRCPMWGPVEVLMDPAQSAGLFYDHLVRLDYNSDDESPGSYAQAVQRSAFPGRYDEHWDEAVSIYNQYATAEPGPGDDFMSALTPAEQRELYDTICGKRPSRSPLRHIGEGLIGNAEDVDFAMDGNVHILVMYLLAKLGEPNTMDLLRNVAANTDPGRQNDALLAQAILADVHAQSVESGSAPINLQPQAAPVVAAVVENEPKHALANSGTAGQHMTQIREHLASISDYLDQLSDAIKELKGLE